VELPALLILPGRYKHTSEKKKKGNKKRGEMGRKRQRKLKKTDRGKGELLSPSSVD
jgi:hypothetical protein